MQELLEKLKALFKVLIILGIIVLTGWGVKKGVNRLFQDATEDTTYPTDPIQTATEFFTHLQGESYQDCYGLLEPGRKAVTAIGKNSRDAYFQHFLRIRTYLTKQIGPDFLGVMTVSPTGETVSFDNYVVLTIAYKTTTSLDKKTHYALHQINEFPIDAAPGIGIEKYNRQVNRAIGDIGTIGADENNLDDPAEIIRDRDESPSQRLKRLIDAFKNAPQLDTKHTVLEWIIKQYSHDRSAAQFLYEIAQSESISPHLRQIAQNAL